MRSRVLTVIAGIVFAIGWAAMVVAVIELVVAVIEWLIGRGW